jgi:hypothetical protein
LKPQGSVLIVSMLIITVSCTAGVWYEVKPRAIPRLGKLIASWFRTEIGLNDKDVLYHDDGSLDIAGQPGE